MSYNFLQSDLYQHSSCPSLGVLVGSPPNTPNNIYKEKKINRICIGSQKKTDQNNNQNNNYNGTKNSKNHSLWRFSLPSNYKNQTWVMGSINDKKSIKAPLLPSSSTFTSSESNKNNNIYSNGATVINLDDILEPRPPAKPTKIEEMVKGKFKVKLGKLLNNEEMLKQGKAIGKGASIYEDNLIKTQKRVRKHINSLPSHKINSNTIIIVN
ncbi:hypothetical protein CYY_004985 [Polysphondylium violaceum]|uniref:Uncharacterized protein n=1 Tax=Polysphondylium violaceum TaxID=133409 RepID=A0A8J4V4M6_9MYCE|nr:hypothetical protein CYY_004985 [Polysphondylium violaceum]